MNFMRSYSLATISGQLVTILYIGLSNAYHLTTLRLFYDYLPGETTTIGYDYSSRNAATIADLYWLSAERPKREAATSRQWFRAPAAGLPRRVECARQTRRALTADPVPDLQPLR